MKIMWDIGLTPKRTPNMLLEKVPKFTLLCGHLFLPHKKILTLPLSLCCPTWYPLLIQDYLNLNY